MHQVFGQGSHRPGTSNGGPLRHSAGAGPVLPRASPAVLSGEQDGTIPFSETVFGEVPKPRWGVFREGDLLYQMRNNHTQEVAGPVERLPTSNRGKTIVENNSRSLFDSNSFPVFYFSEIKVPFTLEVALNRSQPVVGLGLCNEVVSLQPRPRIRRCRPIVFKLVQAELGGCSIDCAGKTDPQRIGSPRARRHKALWRAMDDTFEDRKGILRCEFSALE